MVDRLHGAFRRWQRQQRLWSPSSVKPMLEYYLGKPLAEVETEFKAYMHELAYKQFHRQWE